jgi:hypothetical protein
LPGPKAQIEATSSNEDEESNGKEVKELVRLLDSLQRVRPDCYPSEMLDLGLVEDAAMAEESTSTSIRNTEEAFQSNLFCKHGPYFVDTLAWEPSSHTTTEIPLSEFTDGYFSTSVMDTEKFNTNFENASRYFLLPSHKFPSALLQESFYQPPDFG